MSVCSSKIPRRFVNTDIDYALATGRNYSNFRRVEVTKPFLLALVDATSNTMVIKSLDAYARPPESIKGVYKKYQKLGIEAIQSDPTILDFRQGLSEEQECGVRKVGCVPLSSISAACSHLKVAESHKGLAPDADVPIYGVAAAPGEQSKFYLWRTCHSLLTNQDCFYCQL